MSLSATLFGRDSLIFKATNIMGLGIPGLLDKTFGASGTQPGQSLGELAQQTAKESDPRAIVWGRVRPIGGNLMHCQAPVKRWVTQKTSGGGKGGGSKKQEQKVEHVYRTYAIGVCEGPITAFARIWRNNKLVYDGRGTAWGAANNGVFLRSFRLYLGGWGQMPSPDLEAIWGAGSVPAYRGTAYIVSINEDLTELGGSVPQWLFEVERAEGSYLTSRPYAVENEDSAIGGISVVRMRDPFWRTFADDELGGGISLTELSFRSVQYVHDSGVESVAGGISVQGLEFRRVSQLYDSGVESISGGISVQDMYVRRSLISYQDSTGPDQVNGGISVRGLSHVRS